MTDHGSARGAGAHSPCTKAGRGFPYGQVDRELDTIPAGQGGGMELRWILMAVFALSGDAAAQQVHKCVESGRTIYQSDPCVTGPAAKSWNAAPEAPNPYQQARLDAIRQELEQRRQIERPTYRYAQSGVRGISISKHRDPDRCESAKAHRASVFNAAGIHRSFELTRRMDDMVFDACK